MKTFEQPTSNTFCEPHHYAIATELGYEPESLAFSDAAGGHMAYRRLFARTPDGDVFFIKGQDSSLFTDDQRENHARQYLQKEHMLFQYLLENGYQQTPTISRFIDDSYLLIEGFPTEHGWWWRAPRDNPLYFEQYVKDALRSFDDLQRVPLPSAEHFFPKRIMQVFMEEGWDFLTPPHIEAVQQAATTLRPELHDSTKTVFDEALNSLPELVPYGQELYDTAQPVYLSHHDARQANIAWHPEFGTRNIDLSWADAGWRNSDATMFLIDLAKAGHDVSPYLNAYFNPDHAMLLMGHWFGRCALPTRDGSPIVRLHQLASALTAFKMLKTAHYLS